MPAKPLLEPIAPGDHLTPDEMAARAGEEFLAGAVAEHAHRVHHATPAERGRCLNCGEACHPAGVYCDADCRADHEVRSKVATRLGGHA